MKKVVFLDRDGTINVDSGFVSRIDDWEFTPQAPAALRLLQDAGFALAVITNQSGIARGLYTERDMHTLHEYMQQELAEAGVTIDAIAFCPHDRDSTCDCRKPKAGMAKQIEAKLGSIDYASSWTIGDKLADVGFGRAAGTKTALIKSVYWADDELIDPVRDPVPKGPADAQAHPVSNGIDQPDLVVESLYEAAQQIARQHGGSAEMADDPKRIIK